jgi:hypothetical protein
MNDGLDEASARALNAEPWEPLPGIVNSPSLPNTDDPHCADCVIALVADDGDRPHLYRPE